MGWLASLLTGALFMNFFFSKALHIYIDKKPRVRLQYNIIDMMSFNCSAEGVSNIDDTRMLQIDYGDGDYPRTILAVIDNGGIHSPKDVLHKTLGMGDRSYDITGRFGSDMYWLNLAIFYSKLDKLRIYGTLKCSLWRYEQDGKPVRVVSLTILPEQKLPKGKPGFVVQYSTALDLSCNADIPTSPGTPEFALNITNIIQGSGQAALASWSHNKTLHCSTTPKCLCSPLKNKNEHYYGVTRLMEYLESNQSFECSVKNNEGHFAARDNVCVSCSPGNVSHVLSVPSCVCSCVCSCDCRTIFVILIVFIIVCALVIIFGCWKYYQLWKKVQESRRMAPPPPVADS